LRGTARRAPFVVVVTVLALVGQAGPEAAATPGCLDRAPSIVETSARDVVPRTPGAVPCANPRDDTIHGAPLVNARPKWAVHWDGTTRDDAAVAVASSPVGHRVYVVGYTTDPDSVNFATVAYDAMTGTELWEATYDGTGGIDRAVDVVVSSDGTQVFVTGYSDGGTLYADMATIAYDAQTGTQEWVARFDRNGSADFPVALAVAPDGAALFVAGISGGSVDYDYATVAYDAATGNQLWARFYDSPVRFDFDTLAAVAVSPDSGQVFVTGSTDPNGTGDEATVAYEARNGHQDWVAIYDGGLDDDAAALTVSPDGTHVYVTGRSFVTGADPSYDVTTISYDASTGDARWVATHDEPGGSSDGGFAVLASADDASVYVGGYTEAPDQDYLVISYDASDGSEKWSRRTDYAGEPDDPAAMALNAAGSMLVLAGTTGLDTYSFLTVGYRTSDGAAVFTARYDRPHQLDIASDVAAGPGSSFFVAGDVNVASIGIKHDFLTVAYFTLAGS
jgi:hypothetical protein